MRLMHGFWIGICVLILLSGCITRQAIAPPVTVDELIPAVFALKGRASVKYEGGGDYIHFTWQADKSYEKIQFNSPIGTQVAEIAITPEKAVLRKGKKEWEAPNAEWLMDALLKWHFPIRELHYWLLGLAAPHIQAQWESRADGWHLAQSGWHMYFSEYVEVEEGSNMRRVPKRVDVTHPELQIKIVIGTWMLGEKHDTQ